MPLSRPVVLLLVSPASFVPAAAPAQTSPPQGTSAPNSPLIAPTSPLIAPGASALSLGDLLSHVDEQFPKIVGARADRAAAAGKRVAKQGSFDPVLTTNLDSLRYNSSSSRGKASTTSGGEIGVEVTTPFGAKVAAGAIKNFGSVKSPNSSTGDDGTYFVSFKYPLGRGAGINEKSAGLQQAFNNESLADQGIEFQRISTRLEAASAYWKWVGAHEKKRIADRLLEVAVARLTFVERDIAEKQRAAIDREESIAEVELRRAGAIKAVRDIEESVFKLRKFVGDPRFDPATKSAPALERPVTPDADLASVGRETALERRPELRQLALLGANFDIDARLARNDLRPTVDLVYSPGIDSGARGIGDTLKAGIVVSIPLYLRDARGRLDEASQKRVKTDQDALLTRRIIENEVDDAVSQIARGFERFVAADSRYNANVRVERGERRRFEEGDSTLFLLNLRERTTAESASALIDIQVEYEQARAAYRAATGG